MVLSRAVLVSSIRSSYFLLSTIFALCFNYPHNSMDTLVITLNRTWSSGRIPEALKRRGREESGTTASEIQSMKT